MEWQLAETPPADRLIALYFEGQKWWSPPVRASGARGEAEAEPEVWECPFPDETE